MTAEQAIIDENKKDERVRYITRHFFAHNFTNTFWETKPVFDKDESRWIDGKRLSINNFKYTFNCNDGELCILCIDDIKPEVPPIPENWYIECTENNQDILNCWRLQNAKDYIDYEFCIGYILLSKNESDESLFYGNQFQYFQQDSRYKNYQEITLEQFKKYVLGEEKQNENSSSHSTDSYVKSGSIGGVDISGKYVKTGRIGSVDLKVNPFTSQSNDNAFEFYDKKYWIEDRINYINQFIKRNIDSDLCINPDWVAERNELIEKLKNL